MKNKLFLLLILPLIASCASLKEGKADDNFVFEATRYQVNSVNTRSIQYESTSRGYKIEAVDNSTSTDAFFRLANLTEGAEVKVKNNKYLAIRHRSNFTLKYHLRIQSTTRQIWDDFSFSNTACIGEFASFSGWSTLVYDLNYENALNTTESNYNNWQNGNYFGLSFNLSNYVTLRDDPTSYLYISSFSFFDNAESAKTFTGLEYSSEEDKTGPEITIPNVVDNKINVTAGKFIDIKATAYDAYDDLNYEVIANYSSGALDENGKYVQGNHKINFVATDLSGNVSDKEIDLIVGEKDTIAPVISFNVEKIYVLVGTYNYLKITAYDDVDGEIECTFNYSSGALDAFNRFNEGNHTLTIIASDYTGNQATKTIEIISSNNFNPNGLEVIEETY